MSAGAGWAYLAGAIAWAVLAVVAARILGDELAGLFFACMGLVSFLFLSPLFGQITDTLGNRSSLQVRCIAMILAGLWLLAAPITNTVSLLVWGFVLFVGFAGADISSYILRMSPRDRGGTFFGFSENITSLGTFIGTLSLPFVIGSGKEWLAALALIVTHAICLVCTFFAPNDIKKPGRMQLQQLWSFVPTLRRSWRFMRINGVIFPLLALGHELFDGIFYGFIWFLFPLYIADTALQSSWQEGMLLGVYEAVGLCFAGVVGWLADRYSWRAATIVGYLVTAVGVLLMPLFSWVPMLVVLGFVVGVASMLSSLATDHALQLHDIDHRDDGAFTATNNMVNDLGYAISPLIAGITYGAAGFTASMWVLAGLSVVLCTSLAGLAAWGGRNTATSIT